MAIWQENNTTNQLSYIRSEFTYFSLPPPSSTKTILQCAIPKLAIIPAVISFDHRLMCGMRPLWTPSFFYLYSFCPLVLSLTIFRFLRQSPTVSYMLTFVSLEQLRKMKGFNENLRIHLRWIHTFKRRPMVGKWITNKEVHDRQNLLDEQFNKLLKIHKMVMFIEWPTVAFGADNSVFQRHITLLCSQMFVWS